MDHPLKLSPLLLAAAAIAALAALVSALFAGLIAYVDFYDAPYWDHWYHIDRDRLLADWMARNNEHPMVIDRIFFWLDDGLFDSRGRFLQFVSLALMAVQVATFAWLARAAGLKAWPVAAACFVFVFAAFGFEVLIWVFELSLVAAFTCAVGAMALLAHHKRSGSRVTLALSFLVAWLGVLSLANGLLIPPLLGVMAWLLGMRRTAIGFAVMALAGFAAHFSVGSSASAAAALGHPMEVAAHMLAQLGGPVGYTFGYLQKLGIRIPMEAGAVAAGVLVLAASVVALAFVVMRKRADAVFLALAGVILFALGTAGLTALGRYDMGVVQALSSRYNVNAALLYCAVLIVLIAGAGEAPERWRKLATWAAPVAALWLLVSAMTGYYILADLAGRHRAAVSGLTALVTGVRDDAAIGQLAFDPNVAERETAKMKAAGKWMFADAAALRIGGALTAEEAALAPCGTSAWSERMPHAKDGYRVAAGTFARTKEAGRDRHVLIVDAAGVIVGYGRAPRRPSDLNPLAGGDGQMIDWSGHIRAGAQPPFSAWLSGPETVRCGLGPSGDPAASP